MNATSSTLEAQRLAAIQRYQILDTPPDGAFDRVTAIAARLFQVPIALVTIVDHDRIWFKSRYGLDIPQIAREPGLCASAILQDQVYTITDALLDPRTLTNDLVRGEFGLRFYAAAPLITQEGYRLGTLCVIDHKPRSITPDEKQTLQDLAAIVMDELELRLAARQLVDTTASQRTAINDLYNHAPCGYHALDRDGVIIDINDTELGWLGYDRQSLLGKRRFIDLLTPESQTTFASQFAQLPPQKRIENFELELVRADGSTLWVLMNAIADYDDQGNYVKSRSTVHNICDRKQTELELRQLNQSLEAKVTKRTLQLAERNAELEASNQALHLSIRHFRNAFDYAGIGMALVSLDGQWLEVNRALCEMTGYSEADLLTMDFQSITHPDDLESDLDLVQQLINQEIGHYHLEKRYRHQQGHWFWAQLSVSLVHNQQQQPLYFVAQIQDIHDHKQADIALQKSQAMLLEAQAVGHIGNWEYDVLSNKITWSAEKFRILGRDPALGEPTFDELLRVHHPEDGERLRQAVHQSLTTGQPYNLRLKTTRSDGSIAYTEDRGQAERNEQGEVVRLFGITQDITERMQAEHDRREMTTALAHAVEGISRIDQAGLYLTVNQAYGAIAGYSPDELVGQEWKITVYPDDLDRVRQAHEQMLAQGKAQVEARGLRKDGSIFYKQLLLVAVYDDQQQPQGHYCFMKDITERAQLEADRQRAEIALQQELDRLSKVVEAQQEITLVNPHLDQVMAVITARSQQLTQADGSAVELLDHTELICRACSGIAQPYLGWRVPLDQSLAGRCLAEGQPLYCADSRDDPRVHPDLTQRLSIGSMVVVPLTSQTGPVGVLKVFSTQTHAFSESDRHTLQLIAGLLAASLNLAQEFRAKTTLLQHLQESEERYRSVVSALSEGIIMIQADGTVLACNTSALEILRVSQSQIVGHNIADLPLQLVHDDGSPCQKAERPVWVTLQTGQPITQEILGMVNADKTTWISVNTQPLIHTGESKPYAVVASFTDITEIRLSEVAALRQRAEQERLLSEIAQRIRQTLDLEAILNTTVTEVQQFLHSDRVVIYRFESDGSGTVIAEAVKAGLPSLLGHRITQKLDPRQTEVYQAGMIRACTDIQAEETIPCPIDQVTQARAKVVVPIVQGNRLWGMLLAYSNRGPRQWQSAELDVLKRLAIQIAIAIQQSQLYNHVQTVNRQLEHLATHDGLTQLANRRNFDTYLRQEWLRLVRDPAPLSLILADIDHFKAYNDTYGHPAGDVCLQQVAQLLTNVVKRPADLVARYGGEEFVIVLPSTDVAGAEAITLAIQQALVRLALFHGASPLAPHITLSLGIASTIPSINQSAQTLIDQADEALYAAKQQGRNRYCIAPSASPQ